MSQQRQEKKVPELRFPEFEGEWKKIQLSTVTTFKSGVTPSKDKAEYWKGGDSMDKCCLYD